MRVISRLENVTAVVSLSAEGGDGVEGLISKNVRNIILMVNASFVVPLVAFFGIASNAINLIIFIKIGFEESINISLVCLALADFIALFLQQGLAFTANPFIEGADIIPGVYLTYFYEAFRTTVDCFNKVSALITAFISVERCICVAMPLKVKALITHRRTAFIMLTIYVVSLSFSLPTLFTFSIGHEALSDNTTVITVLWTDNWDQVFRAHYIYHNVTGFSSYFVITISTVILVETLKRKQSWRKDHASDQSSMSKSEKRDKNVAVTVIFISVNSIITTAPLLFVFIGTMIDERFDSDGSQFENLYVSVVSGTMAFATFNSSVNIFIYMKMSSKFRAVFDSLFNRNMQQK